MKVAKKIALIINNEPVLKVLFVAVIAATLVVAKQLLPTECKELEYGVV